LLDHIQSHAAVRFCTRAEIARHWIAEFPAR